MTIDEILDALRAIIETAEAENRPLTEEEATAYEKYEEQLKAAQAADNRRKAIKARHESLTAVESNAPLRRNAKREDTYENAFMAYMRTGQKNSDLMNAQSEGTDTAGGYLVPDTMRQKLTERLKAFGGLATVAEEITTTAGEPMKWPTLDDTANQGTIAAEGAAPTSGGADLAFGEKTLGAYKYIAPGAGNLPLRVSVELLQDAAFDVEALVRRKLGERIGRKQARDWVLGDGTDEPDGIITSTGASFTFTGAQPTYEELVDAKHSVDPDYRQNAVWTFSDASFAEIEKLTDNNGRPLLQMSTDGIEGAPGYTLLGHRVVIDQAFPEYADAVDQTWGAFGDITEGYVIRRVRDLTLIVNPYARANEGQVEYTLWARADGTVQNPWAFSLLKNAVA